MTAGEVLTFPHGLVGMSQLRQFVVVDDPQTVPCRWLQSIQEPALAFLIVDPRIVDPAYQCDLSADDLAVLGLDGGQDADVWAIITVHPDPGQATANLLAPVVVNATNRIGRQVILGESGYSLRHPLIPPAGPEATRRRRDEKTMSGSAAGAEIEDSR